jgi:hypothetical protein
MNMFLFAAAAAATMMVVAPTLEQAQGAGPPPEASTSYVPDRSLPYSSYQWRHDYPNVGNCRVIRHQDVSPSDGRASSRTYVDCD